MTTPAAPTGDLTFLLDALSDPQRREKLILILSETDLIDGLRNLIDDLDARHCRESQYDNGIRYALRRVRDFLDGQDYTQHHLSPQVEPI